MSMIRKTPVNVFLSISYCMVKLLFPSGVSQRSGDKVNKKWVRICNS